MYYTGKGSLIFAWNSPKEKASSFRQLCSFPRWARGVPLQDGPHDDMMCYPVRVTLISTWHPFHLVFPLAWTTLIPSHEGWSNIAIERATFTSRVSPFFSRPLASGEQINERDDNCLWINCFKTERDIEWSRTVTTFGKQLMYFLKHPNYWRDSAHTLVDLSSPSCGSSILVPAPLLLLFGLRRSHPIPVELFRAGIIAVKGEWKFSGTN